MMDACAAGSSGAGFLGSITRFVDCRIEMLDVSAFSALSVPGSPLSALLTGFLTLLVALFGYRLLFGLGVSVRGMAGLVVKAGAVLTLATSWPAYQTLIYNVAVIAPAQLAAEVGGAGGLPGSDGALVQRLDAIDRGLQQLAVFGVGQLSFAQAQALPPPPMAGFDAFALGGSRIVFLVSSLLCILGARVVAGLMLALGPYFITLLLLESTSSFFEGWLRVLAGASLATVGVSLTLGLELTLLEPWLNDALARRAGGEVLPGLATELFVLTSICALIMMLSTYASAKIASDFRFRPRLTSDAAATRSVSAGREQATKMSGRSAERTQQPPSRASITANAVATMKQREEGGHVVQPGSRTAFQRVSVESGTGSSAPRTAVPVGRAFPRRTRSRITASGTRRDGSA